ncbi:MAG: hypothetical protein JNK82_17870 [Myxococcaceae bacterium]|nr:hypothetical protein [Myxococcaceae bacterium]
MFVALSAVLLAQAGDTVLVLRSPDTAWAPLEDRLAAELQASGFQVNALDVVVDPGGDVPGQLTAQCKEHDAVAALWFNPRADGRVDLWVADTLTAKAVLRTYDTPASGSERARLALQAVELLHASLLEVRVMAPNVQRAHPTVRRFASKRSLDLPTFVFGTGFGMAVVPGLTPQPLLSLELGWEFRHHLVVEVQALSSVYPSRVAGRGIAADIGVAQLRFPAYWVPLRGETLFAGLTFGTGIAMTWAAGSVDSGGVELTTEAQVAWLATGGVVVGGRINEGIKLQLIVNVGVTVPEVVVKLDAVKLATIGRPVLDALLRLEFE